ncbi:hypothetical protein DPMN_055384 [Dreissena polymorpha]|uniref:Uncharacterized protein n=1 Tax=Dreissena polymorpha TaxID=45954 RepID=A0A9D4CSA6_DREPO|nr:hypothetical protein DPMN_055384 [Dreissena polymorpha]
MVDLRMKFNTSSADIARSVSAQGLVIFAGALAGGLVIDAMRTWKFLVVTLVETIATVAQIFMPFVASLIWLLVMFSSVGTAAGLIKVGKRLSYRHTCYIDLLDSNLCAVYFKFNSYGLLLTMIYEMSGSTCVCSVLILLQTMPIKNNITIKPETKCLA